jgi:hypothetical protein
VSLDEDEDSGVGREAQFKSRMSGMIEKQKEVIARARSPGLNPDERRKAGHDVVLNMMGQPTFHDIDSALAEANEMPPEEAAEIRKTAMESHRRECAHDAMHDSRVRVHHARLRGSRTSISGRSSARSRNIGRWKWRHLVTRRCNYPPASAR